MVAETAARGYGSTQARLGRVLGEGAPDLVELDLLVSVAETGSLGRAATIHGISQPAVSMRMTGLERRLGLTLLRRDSSGTHLTPVGEDLVASARRVLAAASELTALAARYRAEGAELLRVASSFTVAEHLLPTWVRALQERFPGTSLALEVVNSARVLAIVTDHRVDIGFVEGVHKDLPGLESDTVTTDELVVVVAPGHPWTQRGRPINGEELATVELIVREPGSGTREVLDAALAPWGGTRTRLALGSSSAVLAAARAGDAPGVVSALVAAPEVASGRLVAVPTTGVDLHRELRAVWPADTTLGALSRRLLAITQIQTPRSTSVPPKPTLGMPK
jgi:DNA-binding transcriptional LysR family regulator